MTLEADVWLICRILPVHIRHNGRYTSHRLAAVRSLLTVIDFLCTIGCNSWSSRNIRRITCLPSRLLCSVHSCWNGNQRRLKNIYSQLLDLRQCCHEVLPPSHARLSSEHFEMIIYVPVSCFKRRTLSEIEFRAFSVYFITHLTAPSSVGAANLRDWMTRLFTYDITNVSV